MTDLFIIAAGKGSRMNSNVPKALVPIVDEPCLTTTLQQVHSLGNKISRVFIVTNLQVQDQWHAYLDDLEQRYPELAANLHHTPINSGLGDGHAVMVGLERALENVGSLSSNVIITWGDVFVPQAQIFDELLTMANNNRWVTGLLPAVMENNPYVTLLVDSELNCTNADYSKYGEQHPSGFHDQSVFLFNTELVRKSLSALHKSFWKGGRYITQGGELSLLYTFHHCYNTGTPLKVYETDYPVLSFNTVDEVTAIQQEIAIKWTNKFRATCQS